MHGNISFLSIFLLFILLFIFIHICKYFSSSIPHIFAMSVIIFILCINDIKTCILSDLFGGSI